MGGPVNRFSRQKGCFASLAKRLLCHDIASIVMPEIFRSERQENVFNAVLRGLKHLKYPNELLRRNYPFTDWFASNPETLTVPAAAFGRSPEDYDSACIAIVLNGSAHEISQYRALGTPFAVEVQEDAVVPWRIGQDERTTRPTAGRIPAAAMERFFRTMESKWSPSAVLRAKNIGTPVGPTELDWVDMGLIPALEIEVSTKLDRMLRSALNDARSAHPRNASDPTDDESLFRLVFRLLAAKVFKDRRVPGFLQLDALSDPREALRKVCDYYNEPQNHTTDLGVQNAVARALWTGFGFQNLSVDVLALIAENTLVDEDLRKMYGIHSTPRSIARYMVEHLPVERLGQNERIVVEPCAGHAVFLVAALKRLRDLLGPDWTGQERHRYFAKRLFGFEQDAFAREVSKLCLTLADFPNPNGWNLEKADVFTSRKFADALDDARIVLCNPPFEEFKRSEREHYGRAIGTSKPLEVLKRVLQGSHRHAMIAFVLPLPFLDGQSYRAVRRQISERFAAVDLVVLPDKVFRHAEVETVLMMAHSPVTHERTRVHFSEVLKPQLGCFLNNGTVSRADNATLTPEDAESKGFHVPVLQEVWEHLGHLPDLGSVADIHRGVEWRAPFNEALYLSDQEKPGWLRGLRNVEEGFEAFSPPTPSWLNPDPRFRLYDAWSLPWERPKVIANAARKARGSWRLAASPDYSGLVCTQRYHCLWPKARWSVQSLAALLNSPICSAFIASHEGSRAIRKSTLLRFPIPKLGASALVMLDGLVDDYLAAMNQQPESRFELWGGGSLQQRANRILLQMDALILKGYGLPPWLERKLLDFFRGERRPVPFEFGDYFPADFAPNIPLWRYISTSFQASRPQTIMPHLPELQDEELTAALVDLT
jgi:hypothetical protein